MSLFSRFRSSGAETLAFEGRLPGFEAATGWLNSPPLTPEELRGKVVLVDFWTYTCINWLRTLAWVRAWAEKYESDGLVVIGVHTPEFPFERDEDNVREAVQEMAVRYPVALDPDFGVWNAFSNSYWPAIYIADMDGRIRYHHYGEATTTSASASSSNCSATRGTRSATSSSPSRRRGSRCRPTGRI